MVSTLPKPVRSLKLRLVTPKQIGAPLLLKKTTAPDPVAADSTPIQREDAEPQLAISSGVALILRTVQFEQSSYVLLGEASMELNQLVQALNANPHWHVYIAGHTDKCWGFPAELGLIRAAGESGGNVPDQAGDR